MTSSSFYLSHWACVDWPRVGGQRIVTAASHHSPIQPITSGKPFAKKKQKTISFDINKRLLVWELVCCSVFSSTRLLSKCKVWGTLSTSGARGCFHCSLPSISPSIFSFHSPSPLLLSHTSPPLSFSKPTILLLCGFLISLSLSLFLTSFLFLPHSPAQCHSTEGQVCLAACACACVTGSWSADVQRRVARQISSFVVILS